MYVHNRTCFKPVIKKRPAIRIKLVQAMIKTCYCLREDLNKISVSKLQ